MTLLSKKERGVLQKLSLEVSSNSKTELPIASKNKALLSLSSLVQAQLFRLQNDGRTANSNCSGPTLLCGHHLSSTYLIHMYIHYYRDYRLEFQ